MTPTLDTPFEWRSTEFANPDGSMCRLRRFETTEMGTIVLFSEVWANPGCSITNGAESLLLEASKMLGIELDQAFWIEHYDGNSYEKGREKPDFSRVRLDENGDPVWSPLPENMIRRLLGDEIFREHEDRLAELKARREAIA